MKKVKIIAAMMGIMLLFTGVLSGCAAEWEVNTGEIEGGPLYTLQEIYDAQAIRRRDFLNIAYYNGDQKRNRWKLRNFEPEPFEDLSGEISLKMCESMAESYRNDGTQPEATAENFSIKVYLGCYNGYYAARFATDLFAYPDEYLGPNAYVYEVGGIKYRYAYTTHIYLWKES